MNKYPYKWQRICIWIIELLVILFLILQLFLGILFAIFFSAAIEWDLHSLRDRTLIYSSFSWVISSLLLIHLLGSMRLMQTWAAYSSYKKQKEVTWMYSLAVLFFILSTMTMALLYKNEKYLFSFLFSVTGGGSLPLYIYCAQFLFPPRPRLRFVSSLCIIPVSFLWIWCLVLLAFKWLGS